jgi:hypothetical protein
MSVRTTPMIAIPLAVNLSPFAMIVSRSRNPSCNQFAHAPPMIAIPPPDVCRSLQVAARIIASPNSSQRHDVLGFLIRAVKKFKEAVGSARARPAAVTMGERGHPQSCGPGKIPAS